MLGNIIAKIRKDKNMTKVLLSSKTDIDVGHITHIEKGERNPSHKALRKISEALEVPYQNLAYMYDQPYTEDEKRYKLTHHIEYNKIIAINSIDNFINCPKEATEASLAFKIHDDVNEPKIKKNSYAFLELNKALSNRDFGLFKYNNELIIRRFIIRQDKLVLRPENKNYDEINLSENDEFTIIGRVIPNNN